MRATTTAVRGQDERSSARQAAAFENAVRRRSLASLPAPRANPTHATERYAHPLGSRVVPTGAEYGWGDRSYALAFACADGRTGVVLGATDAEPQVGRQAGRAVAAASVGTDRSRRGAARPLSNVWAVVAARVDRSRRCVASPAS